MHKKEKIDSFTVVGISVRTSNQKGEASIDLGVLWERFYLENIRSKIPLRVSDEVYCIYTDYESNYLGKYTAIIGHKTSSSNTVPEGLTSYHIKGGQYLKYTAKGGIPAIVTTWQKIWNDDPLLNRKYTIDFEVYGEKSKDIEQAEIDIYLAVN